jgi:hypothetical protein
MSYVLLGGADSGASGVLDHSSNATFATLFVGLARRYQLGHDWSLEPRAVVGAPLPPGGRRPGRP